MNSALPVVSEELVQRLLAVQFPQYALLRVSKVEPGGNDNRTFRIGDDLSARLPSAEAYVSGIEKEHEWLPFLADRLPFPIPILEGLGTPGEGYPWPWSINRWMIGSDATMATHVNRPRLAKDLGHFLSALRDIDGEGGPVAGAHSFFRGASLTNYDSETRGALEALEAVSTSEFVTAATRIWNEAVASEWDQPPVWFHGDLAPSNVLTHQGRLSAVIDFGTCGVGDPSCDLAIAWTLFKGDERRIFANAVGLDARTWSRGRGWALWKASITALEGGPTSSESLRVIAEVIEDPVRT
jgi:aminoglycoside phosphotransferase (APT) family kinase protein